jgi:putative membrane protein
MSLFKHLGFARTVVVLALLPFACISGPASARSCRSAAAMCSDTRVGPVDYNFVAQANLGAPFQIDSGRIAERKATGSDLQHYAHLMVITHIPVVDALNKILQRKGIVAPQNTLLHGAYNAMIASLNSEQGSTLDRDYVIGQVEYQQGNAALFRDEIRNGRDPDLKEFARQTLPKIEDHLKRAQQLAKEEKLTMACPNC